MQASVRCQLLVCAAEKASDSSRLSAFREAVHHPHCLPVEVHITLHRKQRVHPPRRVGRRRRRRLL